MVGREPEQNNGVARGGGNASRPAGISTGRVALMAYGVAAYATFVVVLLYTIGFVTDADVMVGGVHIVGKSIDRGGIGTGAATVSAVVIDVALLALFAVQHSAMARASFKRWWTRIVPPTAERSTYVNAANLCLIALIAAWHPITGDVWRITGQPWRALLIAIGLAGWAITLLSSLLIDHFELFGLRQAFARPADRPPDKASFATPFLYRAVRHPLYLGFLLAFWATPRMTLGHLLFATAMTAYILVGVRFEERDLISMFGQQYRDYRGRVPMLIPGLGGHVKPTAR
jgi:methanethiol S-methyltransferase